MKTILKTFIFTIISISLAQYVIKAFDYGSGTTHTFLLISIAVSLLYLVLRPILKLVSLPSEGIGYILISTILTFIILYVLSLVVPAFSIKETNTPDLIILGFMLPSKHLTALWSAICSAFFVSIIFSFFNWLSSKK